MEDGEDEMKLRLPVRGVHVARIKNYSGEVLRINPTNSNFSWNALSLDEDNIIAVSSSLVDVPRIKYGYLVDRERKSTAWNWLDVPSPTNECSEKVESLLSSLQFSIMKIPVRDVSDSLTKGARNPFEAIFVSSKTNRSDSFDPLIVFIHGGPHTVSSSSFSKSLAFLSAIGFNLLLVNYRGSLGFGEEALQSLPGNIGSQDVNDVLVAIDHVIDVGLASPSKMAVLGGSHGGFLTTHLIGQVCSFQKVGLSVHFSDRKPSSCIKFHFLSLCISSYGFRFLLLCISSYGYH
uniref:acylamino-acid-releasing enzyme-like n=1 Tax=Fragaria vesca subsp. vesca TaxID=101020 RepID=UPI0005CA4460|nr:PREDICTED: acylamino-acid-releasing enzyme-like [Fragaria vesca subsp. vesca]